MSRHWCCICAIKDSVVSLDFVCVCLLRSHALTNCLMWLLQRELSLLPHSTPAVKHRCFFPSSSALAFSLSLSVKIPAYSFALLSLCVLSCCLWYCKGLPVLVLHLIHVYFYPKDALLSHSVLCLSCLSCRSLIPHPNILVHHMAKNMWTLKHLTQIRWLSHEY